jgi:hypothetical protein
MPKARRPQQRRRALPAPDPHAFGASSFVHHLRRFVADRCPDPAETRPVLELDLHDGTKVDVCHVIGLGTAWAALAAYDEGAAVGARVMKTVLVPYESIIRVTLRGVRHTASRLGFTQEDPPPLIDPTAKDTAEAVFRSAAQRPRKAGADAGSTIRGQASEPRAAAMRTERPPSGVSPKGSRAGTEGGRS